MSSKSFKVTFVLDEKDANYFRSLFRKAKAAAKNEDPDEIPAASETMNGLADKGYAIFYLTARAVEAQDVTRVWLDTHHQCESSLCGTRSSSAVDRLAYRRSCNRPSTTEPTRSPPKSPCPRAAQRA